MSKPDVKKHLDWPELRRWFSREYPKEFNEQMVSDWLTNDRSVSNGELVTAWGETLDQDEDSSWQGPGEPLWDIEPIKFFVQKLQENFPEATNEYGDVKIHYWW